METAHIYFACMVVLMVPLILVHLSCWRVVDRYPHIMPDDTQRSRYGWSEIVMAATCAAMIWYMWLILPFMVTFCATDFWGGFNAHAPWIIGTFGVLVFKTRHLSRLVSQA